jgi:hypothetical protein
VLEALAMRVGESMHLWRMEGETVVAYTTAQDFPTGESLLTICEDLYQAFAVRRLDIIQNTTCPGNGCANVAGLDLKIMAHHGAFDEMSIGPMNDISDAEVISVHRMAKTELLGDLVPKLRYVLAFSAIGVVLYPIVPDNRWLVPQAIGMIFAGAAMMARFRRGPNVNLRLDVVGRIVFVARFRLDRYNLVRAVS